LVIELADHFFGPDKVSICDPCASGREILLGVPIRYPRMQKIAARFPVAPWTTEKIPRQYRKKSSYTDHYCDPERGKAQPAARLKGVRCHSTYLIGLVFQRNHHDNRED
jgi:hypothetical protein